MTTIIKTVAVVFTFALARQAATAVDLPRYKFEAGQELVYQSSSQFDFNGGAFKNSDVTTFWVTRQNPNQSWHLVFLTKTRNVRTGDFASTNEDVLTGSFDLSADGRLAGKASLPMEASTPPIFVPLPTNSDQLKSGWEVSQNEAAQTGYHVKQSPAKPGGLWTFASADKGIFHDVYQSDDLKTTYFDEGQGLIEKIESENKQGFGFTGQGTGSTELKSNSVKKKEWIADASALESSEAAIKTMFESIHGGAKAEDAKASAKHELDRLRDRVKNDVFRDQIESDIKRVDGFHFSSGDEETDSAINKPAVPWSTTDLDGKKHTLEEYRGKVVALDFWYRGCGWCMRAMPQVKALVDQFHGQPVVVLGMNTDQNDSDAKFVVDKLKLNYTTLHGTGIPEKYGVQGFPTFIVIDQKGVVRARHVGYSPTLREDMAKTIADLLAKQK